MKVYVGDVDWADEGDVFFFSVECEENLKAMKSLIEIISELDLSLSADMYWGTNEYFDFNTDDLLAFIDGAKDISEEELAVFDKFGVSGFDIYRGISDSICDSIWDSECDITQEDLDRIKPLYIELYGQESWDSMQQWFESRREHDD